jgi:ABC-type nitrate/sulfonate/bicarbonate transport system substrate-binding protein
MPTPTDLTPVRVSMMNAVHDLAVLVARDAGFFRDEGLDVEMIKTPGGSDIHVMLA